MLSEDTRRSIDRIWDTFWANETTNPLTVVEQITFIIFAKLLDDNQIRQEQNANLLHTIAKFKVRRRAHEKEVDRFRKWFNVPKQEIADNGYDLSFNKYHLVPHVKEEFPPTKEIVAELKALVKELDDGLAKIEGGL